MNQKKENVFTQAGEITRAIHQLIELKLIEFLPSKVQLYGKIWKDNTHIIKENYVRNVYLYMCIMQKHKQGDPLVFEDIETGKVLARYENERVSLVD